jgi:hypothetical protein
MGVRYAMASPDEKGLIVIGPIFPNIDKMSQSVITAKPTVAKVILADGSPSARCIQSFIRVPSGE